LARQRLYSFSGGDHRTHSIILATTVSVVNEAGQGDDRVVNDMLESYYNASRKIEYVE